MTTSNERNIVHTQDIAKASARTLSSTADIVRTLKPTRKLSQALLIQYANELDRAAVLIMEACLLV